MQMFVSVWTDALTDVHSNEHAYNAEFSQHIFILSSHLFSSDFFINFLGAITKIHRAHNKSLNWPIGKPLPSNAD